MLNLYNLKNTQTEKKPTGNTESTLTKKVDLKNYFDTNDGLSSRELKWGLWFANHKVFLYKFLLTLLIFINVFVWVFSLYKWGFYLWNSPEHRLTEIELSQSVDYTNINKLLTAKPLQILGVNIINSGVKKYDAVADVVNANSDFIAYFNYYYDFGSYQTEAKKIFLLPEAMQPVSYLGIESATTPNNPNLVISELKWQHLSAHKYQDLKNWQASHLDFKISDFNFIKASTGSNTVADAHIIKFKLTNNTPYNYKKPSFMIGLYSSGNFVGLIPLQFEVDFKSLQIVEVDLRSFASQLSVDKVVIFPQINIYDQNSYSELIKQ